MQIPFKTLSAKLDYLMGDKTTASATTRPIWNILKIVLQESLFWHELEIKTVLDSFPWYSKSIYPK